jgi:hypothetical protein
MPASYLNRSDGDIYILFLSGNGVVFQQPTQDYWFRAATKHGFLGKTSNGSDTPYYIPDIAASPLGCVSQHQYCISEQTRCGPLASPADALQGAFDALTDSSSAEASSRLTWFASILTQFPTSLEPVMATTGAEGLLARQELMQGIQVALSDNQWQLEVASLWATTLAVLQ